MHGNMLKCLNGFLFPAPCFHSRLMLIKLEMAFSAWQKQYDNRTNYCRSIYMKQKIKSEDAFIWQQLITVKKRLTWGGVTWLYKALVSPVLAHFRIQSSLATAWLCKVRQSQRRRASSLDFSLHQEELCCRNNGSHHERVRSESPSDLEPSCRQWH